MTISSETIAVILNGGRGRRLKGAKKYLLHIDSRPIIEHQLKVLKTIFSEIIIVGRDDPVLKNLYCTVIEDTIKNIGPAGGIVSALNYAGEEKSIFVFGCDMPFLNPIFIKEELIQFSLKTPDMLLTCESNGRVHPLHSIYSIKVLPVFERCIKKGIYSIRKIIMQNINVERFILLEEYKDSVININTQEDLQLYNGKSTSYTYKIGYSFPE